VSIIHRIDLSHYLYHIYTLRLFMSMPLVPPSSNVRLVRSKNGLKSNWYSKLSTLILLRFFSTVPLPTLKRFPQFVEFELFAEVVTACWLGHLSSHLLFVDSTKTTDHLTGIRVNRIYSKAKYL
jgi:hypothetical protein